MSKMEEQQRARLVARAGATVPGGNGGASRSQWHGMDLHTMTPSSHGRAMYISPVPAPAHASNAPHGTTSGSGGESARMRAEAAALSARNQVLHRRLSERKRFDSADYAMKIMRRAMQNDLKESPSSPPPPQAASPPPSGSPSSGAGGVAGALQSPRLSPTHGRMVFAHALKDARGGDPDHEMKAATFYTSNQDAGSPSSRLEPTASPMRAYGSIQKAVPDGKSASAAMSARNIMIQKKLQEKRHFDSADYQLARLGVSNDVRMEEVGAPALDRRALPFTRTPSPMTLNVADAAASSPVNSPSAARAAISRSNQMSPSVRTSSGATAFGGPGDAGKYGSLGARWQSAKPQNDLRRNTLLRQQENFIAAQNSAVATVAAAAQTDPHPSQGTATQGNQKYGKLIAANILFRKNLKDRQRFDSADYEMEAAAKQAERAGQAAPTSRADNNVANASNQDEEPSSPVMKPQAKHIKLSDDNAMGGWAPHQKAAPAQHPQQPVAVRGGWAAHPAVAAARKSRAPVCDDGARLAARNVLLSRKLSEGKKLFDSGEYFAAKEKEARAASSRGAV